MSLISDYLSKNLTSLTKEQLSGAKKIITGCFNNYTSLRSIGIPYSVKKICINAFEGCLNLTEIDSSSMDPFCWLPVNLDIDNPIMATGWYSNAPVNSMITLANGQILVGNKITTPGSGFVIPNTVKNIAGGACKRYGSAVDSSFTNVIIPDTVEIVGDEIFYNQTALTKITVGSSVKKILGLISPGTSMKNMIFRQPAGMVVELPTPGSENGMAYNKSAYSMNIYTDNEYIKNYGWSTDNVTATFYSLSSAP